MIVHTGTERLRIGFCFCSHGNAIVPFHSFLLSPCQFFQQQLHSHMRLGQKSYHSVFWTSLAPHCLFTRERNGTIAYRFTFHITYFIVPLFGTERCYFKRSRVNATPERSTFRNGTIWKGTIAFPCERGLRLVKHISSHVTILFELMAQPRISFHFIFIYLNRVKLQLHIHKLLYKLPCTMKEDKTLKHLQSLKKIEVLRKTFRGFSAAYK